MRTVDVYWTRRKSVYAVFTGSVFTVVSLLAIPRIASVDALGKVLFIVGLGYMWSTFASLCISRVQAIGGKIRVLSLRGWTETSFDDGVEFQFNRQGLVIVSKVDHKRLAVITNDFRQHYHDLVQVVAGDEAWDRLKRDAAVAGHSLP